MSLPVFFESMMTSAVEGVDVNCIFAGPVGGGVGGGCLLGSKACPAAQAFKEFSSSFAPTLETVFVPVHARASKVGSVLWKTSQFGPAATWSRIGKGTEKEEPQVVLNSPMTKKGKKLFPRFLLFLHKLGNRLHQSKPLHTH